MIDSERADSYSVEKHLDEAREAGAFHDEGTITLSRDEAFRKLAAHALGKPGLWVLKFVQAAVAAQAKEPIDFKLFRKRTQITLQNPEEWTSEFILDLLQSKVSTFSRAAGHLKMGLLGALGDGNHRIAWTYRGTTCTFDREGASFKQESTSTAALVVTAHRGARSYTIAQRTEKPLRYVLAHAVHEYAALTSRCGCSPVEIRVDGLGLLGGYAPGWQKLPFKATVASEETRDFHILLGEAGVAPKEEEKTLSWPLPTAVYQFVEGSHFTTDYLDFTNEARPCKAVFALYYGVRRYSQITYVHDGVELQSFPLRPEDVMDDELLREFITKSERNVRYFPFNLTVEADADRIDLSGFGVRPYPQEELFGRVRSLFVRMVERALRRCHLPWRFVAPAQSKSRLRNISVVGVGAGVSGVASLLVPGLNIIIIPAVAICTMVDRAGLKAVGKEKGQKILREHCQEILDLLS